MPRSIPGVLCLWGLFVYCVLFFTRGVRILLHIMHWVICSSFFFRIRSSNFNRIFHFFIIGIFFRPTYHIGFCVGLIINNLLIVNNYRDFEEDSKSGKRTTIVLFGRTFGKFFFLAGSIVASILPALFEPNCWLCLLNIPFVIMIARKLSSSSTKDDFNQVLTLSALLMVSYSISISLGFYLKRIV